MLTSGSIGERQVSYSHKSSVKRFKENLPLNTLQNEKQTVKPLGGDLQARVQIIEQNLNRVCLQQDALMPLLNLLDFIPSFTKNEGGIKAIQRRLDEQENKSNQQQSLIEQIILQQQEILDNESSWLKNEVEEFKTHIIECVQQQLDQKIDDIQRSFMEEQANIMEKIDEQTGNTISKNNFQIQINNIEKKVSDQMSNQNSEFKNIYREIEGLRIQLDFFKNEDLKKKVNQQLSKIPYQIDDLQKMITIQHFEMKEEIQALIQFENSTMDKLNDDLYTFAKSLKHSQINSDQQRQSFVKIKYQIAACKMKYITEIEKISRKQNQLNNLLNEQKKENSHFVIDIISQQKALDLEIKQLVERIRQNLDQLSEQTNKIK